MKKFILFGVIAFGVYYLLKKRKVSLGQVSRLPQRPQFWPQETIYIPKNRVRDVWN